MIGICCVVSADDIMRNLWESNLNSLGFVVLWHKSIREARAAYPKIYPDIYLIDVDCVNLKGVSFFYGLKNYRNRITKKGVLIKDSMMIYGISKYPDLQVFSFIDQFVSSPLEIPPIQCHYQSSRNNLRGLLLD